MKIILLFILMLPAVPGMAQRLTVHITGIRSRQGTILLSVFKDDQSFRDEKPYRIQKVSKDDMSEGNLTVVITGLPPGRYGLALLDDENNNGKMDYGLLMPREGFGFSDFVTEGLKRPVLDDFDFTLGDDEFSVSMRVIYR